MQVVEETHDYPVPAKQLWALATNLDHLETMNAPLIRFSTLPDGRLRTGLVIETRVSVYGVLPSQPYRIEVLTCDDDTMLAQTTESGSGVRSWNHTITVTETENGSRLTDRIEIDAGVLTFAYAWWARKLYRHRDTPRRTLLGLNKD
ncbi:SRPBCC family protein [Phaeobacter marinintestinus]|uniref:SRPBCC family protein n=1 Tax=Falsiphaeobacter marinintestinus TaxID=1492905 RepID=UPI0011B81C68|nr:SRPBCC family protein [Phaeobacter marinintestinus]